MRTITRTRTLESRNGSISITIWTNLFQTFFNVRILVVQIQLKSFKPEHLEPFSTLATQANKQAGGAAKVVCKVETIAIKVEIFKNEAMVKDM